MPRLPASPPLDSYSGRERELVELISPYCQGHDVRLVRSYPAFPSDSPMYAEVRCVLRAVGDPQTSREVRAALFDAAQGALDALTAAGWGWVRSPEINIKGERFQNRDELTWDDCYRGTLELDLEWKEAG